MAPLHRPSAMWVTCCFAEFPKGIRWLVFDVVIIKRDSHHRLRVNLHQLIDCVTRKFSTSHTNISPFPGEPESTHHCTTDHVRHRLISCKAVKPSVTDCQTCVIGGLQINSYIKSIHYSDLDLMVSNTMGNWTGCSKLVLSYNKQNTKAQ